MALNRYVIGTTVTLPAGTPTAVSGGFGMVSWAGAGTGATQQWVDGMPASEGRRSWPGRSSWPTPARRERRPPGAQQLYTVLTAAGANLRAYVQGQDDVATRH